MILSKNFHVDRFSTSTKRLKFWSYKFKLGCKRFEIYDMKYHSIFTCLDLKIARIFNIFDIFLKSQKMPSWSDSVANSEKEACPYQILGVSPSVSQQELQNAFRKLVRLTHPDVTTSINSTEEKDKVILMHTAIQSVW